jgi:hypothetical protein
MAAHVAGSHKIENKKEAGMKGNVVTWKTKKWMGKGY